MIKRAKERKRNGRKVTLHYLKLKKLSLLVQLEGDITLSSSFLAMYFQLEPKKKGFSATWFLARLKELLSESTTSTASRLKESVLVNLTDLLGVHQVNSIHGAKSVKGDSATWTKKSLIYKSNQEWLKHWLSMTSDTLDVESEGQWLSQHVAECSLGAKETEKCLWVKTITMNQWIYLTTNSSKTLPTYRLSRYLEGLLTEQPLHQVGYCTCGETWSLDDKATSLLTQLRRNTLTFLNMSLTFLIQSWRSTKWHVETDSQ